MNAPAKVTNNAIATWQDFSDELARREKDLTAILPGNVTWGRFRSTAIAAVKQTPNLLNATPRSLFASITKAAQDGLLPDGREGVVTVYNTKVKVKRGNVVYEESQLTAQWNPMLYGLRKRARELDDMVVDAQAVYANDSFLWRQGDDPGIDHKPAALGQPRGALIGAYAIFRDKQGTVLHREVMDKDQIEKTRGQSRGKDSLMWTVFPEEGYRKTVIRRGFKTLPVSEKLDQIVRRDDEQFPFADRPAVEGDNAARIPATSSAKQLAGPPPAPPGDGGGEPGAQPQRTGEPANPAGDAVEEATVVEDGEGTPVSGRDPQGAVGDAGGVADAASPRPPGVGPDGRVTDYAAFAAWTKQTLIDQTEDATGVWETWEERIAPYRERMPPNWYHSLKGVMREVLAELMGPPVDVDG